MSAARWSWVLLRHGFHMTKQRGRQLRSGGGEPLAAFRAHTGRPEAADHLAVGAQSIALEHENVLHADDVAFHPGDLRYLGHLARTISHARHLDDQVDRRRD